MNEAQQYGRREITGARSLGDESAPPKIGIFVSDLQPRSLKTTIRINIGMYLFEEGMKGFQKLSERHVSVIHGAWHYCCMTRQLHLGMD
jgi:hypothetical protein